MTRDPAEVLETIATAATSKSHAPAADRLAAIVETAAGPLSDRGVRQLCAALADVVARHPSGVLPYADQIGTGERFRQRLAAHGLLVVEVPR